MNLKLWLKILLGLAVSGIIAILAVYIFIYNKPHTDYAQAEPVYRLEARELFMAYTTDKVMADSLYTGKVIAITGPLAKSEVLDSLTIAVFVFGEGMFGDEGVRCTMLPAGAQQLKQHTEGQTISLKGYCAGFNDTDVILQHGSLIN